MSDPERDFLNRNEHSPHLWCVVRHLSNFQSMVVAQFASRAEAEARVRFLNRARTTACYEVVFDESITTRDRTRSRKDFGYQDF